MLNLIEKGQNKGFRSFKIRMDWHEYNQDIDPEKDISMVDGIVPELFKERANNKIGKKSTKEDTVFLKQGRINLNKLLMVRDLCKSNDVIFMYYNLLMPLALGKCSLMGGRETPIYSADQLMLLKNSDVEAWKLITNSRENFIGLNVYNDWVSWTQKAQNKYFGTEVGWEIRHNKEWPNQDRHPSPYGQQLIANDFYNHYDKYF